MPGSIKLNMICASVDLGTNAFRLLIVDKREDVKVLKKYRTIVSLGAFINKDSRLIPPKKYYKALDKIFSMIKLYKVEKIKIVGTSVFRDATNKKSIIKEFKKIYSYNLNIITPKKEAYLSTKGVLSTLKRNNKKNLLIIDIGGGSTELILVKDSKVIKYVSLNVGVVKLLNLFGFKGKINSNKIELIKAFILKKIDKEFIEAIKREKFDLVFNAGTATTLAAMKLELSKYNHSLINGYRINVNYVDDVISFLPKLNLKERLSIVGLEKGREKVIIYGILILRVILLNLRKRVFLVSDSGVLEGLIQEIDWFFTFNEYIEFGDINDRR